MNEPRTGKCCLKPYASSMHKIFLLQVWIVFQTFSFHAFHLRTSSAPISTHGTLANFAATPGGVAFVTTSGTRRSVINATNSTGAACTLWDAYCQAPVPPIGKYSKPWGPFWAPSAWGPCSQKCGRNGTQMAIIDCYSKTFQKVDASNCAHLPIIKVEQPCNQLPCAVYHWYEGPWTECTQPCDIGSQIREVICIDNLGNTADPDYCGGEDTATEFQYCNMEHCSKPKWHGSQWSRCSDRCGGGFMTRHVECVLNGTALSENSCFNRDKPPSQQICSPQPCHPHTWLAGPWSNCSAACGSITTRVVQCVDEKGKKVPEVNCPAEPPATTSPCPPALLNCSDCAYNNCSGNGYCPDGNRCLCHNDWQGRYCEKAASCEKYLGVMGFTTTGRVNCCSTIDANYTCCPGVSSLLDKKGNCCDAGLVDACGICNGTGIFVDSLLQCCSTVRDEKGICCLSGFLDECYVCDGDGLSCGATLALTLGFTTTLTMNFNSWQAFTSRMINSVSLKLNVAASAITVNGMQVQNLNPDCTIDPMNCGAAGIFAGIATFVLDILPIVRNTTSRPLVRKADIEPNLIAISGSSQVEQDEVLPGAEIISISNVSRLGVCGNGLCEIGERCTALGRSADAEESLACCLDDCPYVLTPCPTAAGTVVTCSGHGMCMDTTGHCNCFVGYAGTDCSECLTGWQVSVYGGCLRVPNMDVMRQFNMEFKHEGGLSTSMVVILLGILGGCTYLLIKHQKTIAQLQPGPPVGLGGHPGSSSPIATETPEDMYDHYNPHDDHLVDHHDDEGSAPQRKRWRPSYLGQQSDYDVIPITPRPPVPGDAHISSVLKLGGQVLQPFGLDGEEERQYKGKEEQTRRGAEEERSRRHRETQRTNREAEARERDGQEEKQTAIQQKQKWEESARQQRGEEHRRTEVKAQGPNRSIEAQYNQVTGTSLAGWEHEQKDRDGEVTRAAEYRRVSREKEEKRRLSWQRQEEGRDAEIRKDVERRRASREMDRAPAKEMPAASSSQKRLSVTVPNHNKSQLQMTNLVSSAARVTSVQHEQSQRLTVRESSATQSNSVHPVGTILTDSDSDAEPEEKLHFNDLIF